MKQLLSGLLFFAFLAFVGCDEVVPSTKASYFDGAVLVECIQSKTTNQDSSADFHFFEKGTYAIGFSIPQGQSGGMGNWKLPDSFNKTFNETPREIVVRKPFFPACIRITITKDAKSEFHDFWR